MKCSICKQDILPHQDRHSDSSGNKHGCCESGDKPNTAEEVHKSYSIRLNFFEGPRTRLWGENWKE